MAALIVLRLLIVFTISR